MSAAVQAKAAGARASALRAGGFTCKELAAAGFTELELYRSGYSVAEVGRSCHVCYQCHTCPILILTLNLTLIFTLAMSR